MAIEEVQSREDSGPTRATADSSSALQDSQSRERLLTHSTLGRLMTQYDS